MNIIAWMTPHIYEVTAQNRLTIKKRKTPKVLNEDVAKIISYHLQNVNIHRVQVMMCNEYLADESKVGYENYSPRIVVNMIDYYICKAQVSSSIKGFFVGAAAASSILILLKVFGVISIDRK